jgi:ATP-binding protein involved in chromosome partitioning
VSAVEVLAAPTGGGAICSPPMKSYADVVGDGGSGIVAQVEARNRDIAKALAGVRHLVAVASGKGGVGKSTLAMGLALALRRRGAAAAILDADFNGPTQARLGGLEATPWLPGERGLTLPRRPDGVGVVSFGSVLATAAPLEFASASRGDGHTWRAIREFTLLGQLLAAVEWGELDVLVLDLPPGAERTVHYFEFLRDAAGASGLPTGRPPAAFVLVTIPSDLSRGVVARSITALRAAGGRLVGYVENMAGYACPGCGEVRPLFPAAGAALDAPRLGAVPFDPELAALCDRGWPAEESARLAGSAAFRAIDEIAGTLLPALENPR